MAKLKKATLVKHIKALNKKKLTDKIAVKGDVEDLKEDFISAIEDIDDNGTKIEEVPEAVIDFYEGLIDDDDDDEKADKKSSKGKKGKKAKAKDEDDDDDDDDDDDEDDDDEDDDDDSDDSDDDLEETLEDMTLKELKAYVKENDIDVEGKITKKTRDEVIKQILAAGEADEDDDDEDDDDEDEVDLSELSLKELKAKAKEVGYKGKVTKKTRDDAEAAIEELMEGGSDDDEDEDDDDDDDEGFDLDEADVDEIVEYCDENGIKLSKKQKKYKVKKLRKLVAKKMAAADDGGKADKKADKKGKERELPKGLRKNTLPGEIFKAIKAGGEDGTPMSELGELVAKAKNKGKKKKDHKKPLQFYGFVQRTVARKIAAAEGISALQKHASSGNEGDAVFYIEED